MKMQNIMLRFVGACAIAAMSSSAFASETMDTFKDKMFNSYQASIVKNGGQYYMKLEGETSFDRKGSKLNCCGFNISEGYNLGRTLLIPVKVEILEKKGADYHFQLGVFDNDVATGKFSSVERLQVSDLFTTYEGKSRNVGVIIFGAGYASVKADNGIKLYAATGTLFFPAPSGIPMGVSGGLESSSYKIKISTSAKAAKVDYVFVDKVTNSTHVVERKSEVISLDDVMSADLVK